jgi:maleate isomerase
MKRIGLIILASDPTIEREWRAMVPADVDFLVSRVPYANACTTENLQAMAGGIEQSASLILPGISLDAIAYACTSASVAIGQEGLSRLLGNVHPGIGVATPITGAIQAIRHLNVSNIAILAPYLQDTSENVFQYFRNEGLNVISSKALNIASDYDIADVDEQTIIDACEELDGSEAEAIFLSCTGLTASHLIDELENRHAKPVLTSNQCLLWQCLKICGYPTEAVTGYGRLFQP